MNELALFAGAGGGILGGKLLGWRTVCAVEREAYAAQVLAQRQNDGLLEAFPIWSDVCSFDGKPWRGIVDIISGGFPCQDISAAGKGGGITAERSGLWKEMARIIGEVRPRYVFVENSPMLTTRGLGTVLGDLAALGFDAEWGVLSAADVGANHKRERIWIVGWNPNSQHDTAKQDVCEGAVANSSRNSKLKKFNKSTNANRQLANTNMLGRAYRQTEINTAEAKLNAQCDTSAGCENVGNTNNDGQVTAKIRKGVIARGDSGTSWQEQASEFTRPGEQYGQLADITSKRLERKQWEIAKRGGGGFADKSKALSNTNSPQRKRVQLAIGGESQRADIGNSRWWSIEPNVGRVADGVAFRVDRLKGIGNGQVPLCHATAFNLLKERLEA